eukprot:scaffold33090_cov38-Cyclotella_meneghiniana.AAC.7
MTEPDELYTLRAQYWLGHYSLALDEGRQAARRPMPPHLKSEREEMMLRSQLALGQYDAVISEGGGSPNPTLQALALHARLLGDPSTSSSVLDSLKAILSSPEAASNTSLQLIACHIYLAANHIKEALQCADEDSVLAQLGCAHLSVAYGRSKAEDAVHILSGLSEQYGPSVLLLNSLAVANMVGGKYELAEGNLNEALQQSSGGGANAEDADTLVNLVVCMQHMGKSSNEIGKYLGMLREGHGGHPFVQGLVQVEGAFERESHKYLSA